MSHRRLIFSRYFRLLLYAVSSRYGWLAILSVTLLSTFFSVLTPWPMKVLVDQVLGNSPFPHWLASLVQFLPAANSPIGLISWIAAAGIIIFAVNSVLDIALTWLWIRVGQGMVYGLAADLFARLQRRSLLFHSRSSVGDSMARISGDSWAVHTVVDTLLFAPLHAGITLVTMFVLMLRLNAPLAILSIAAAPLMTFCSLAVGKKLRSSAHDQRQIESQLQSHVQQTLVGIPIVQAFGQESREHERFRQFAGAAMHALRRTTIIGSFADLGSGLATTLGGAAVLWFGARQVLRGDLTIGALLVFLAYLGSLQIQLKTFTGIYSALQTIGPKVDRVCEILEVEPEIHDRPGAHVPDRVTGNVIFENVSFEYVPGSPVLRNLSLEVSPGQTIAIVGATGAGKSTLVGMIPRFFDPTSGRILLDGRDLKDLSLKALRDHVSLVLQEPFLFPMTIAQNIAYGRPYSAADEIEAAARAACAHDFISRLPRGYDSVIGERGATLSGGERQRLSIARALLKNSPILILDEPTSALDAVTEQEILHATQRLVRGRTTFIIAHRLSTIRQADRILVMQHGRIAEDGSHAKLLRQGGLYSQLHNIQFSLKETLSPIESVEAALEPTKS